MNIQLIKLTLLALLLTSLAACGGGGGGSGNNGGTNGGTTATPQSFSVQLSGVTITRPSNDDAVSVDTSAVDSGTLQYTP